MKGMKAGLIFMFTTMLVFVGTIGTATPTCIGWFYQPKVPEKLKENEVTDV